MTCGCKKNGANHNAPSVTDLPILRENFCMVEPRVCLLCLEVFKSQYADRPARLGVWSNQKSDRRRQGNRRDHRERELYRRSVLLLSLRQV